MLKDLDDALELLLDDAAAPAALRAAEVSFMAPAKSYAPAKTTLNLFLHEVRENLKLRDPEPIVQRDAAGHLLRRPAPLRLDCEYLVTAWPEKLDETAVREGHTLLALAYNWLSLFPTIPSNYLGGALASQVYPPPVLIARSDSKQAVGEFWSALGSPPRPGFSLVVTIAVDPGVQVDVGPPVTAKELRFGPRDPQLPRTDILFQIGGLVRDNAGQPASGATVALSGAGGFARTTSSDAEGRYSFGLLAAGAYSLSAQVPGGAPSPPQAVQIAPNAANEYDLSLP